jgi:hypothetical protein
MLHLKRREKKMKILVAEVDGKAVSAFNVDTDEVEMFLGDELGDEERSSHFRIATDQEAGRWEASWSRRDMTGGSYRLFAKL